MINFKFKNYIYIFLFCAAIFYFSLNVFAEEISISSCDLASNDNLESLKYPCVDSVEISEDGEVKSEFTNGAQVKINANVRAFNEVEYVRVLIKDGGTLVSLIELKDDGSAKNADATADDGVYSSNWRIPNSFESNKQYTILILAADVDGNRYKSEIDDVINEDDNDGFFSVGELCDPNKENICDLDDYTCDDSMRRKCVLENSLGCNYWQNSKNCDSGVCCESVCCDNEYICSTDKGCIYCDNKCDGDPVDDACVGDEDHNEGGCCGDNVCNGVNNEDGECGSCKDDCSFDDCKDNDYCDPLVGEDPRNNPNICVDKDPPSINIQSPNGDIYFDSEFVVSAEIIDNFYEIKSDPTFVIIRESDSAEVNSGNLLQDGTFNNIFSSEAPTKVDESWAHGTYIIEITASDIQPGGGNGLSNTVSAVFNVLCNSECENGNTYCSPVDINSGYSLFTQECKYDNGIGCFIRENKDNCSEKADANNTDSIGVCKVNIDGDPNCCEENCNTSEYNSECNGEENITECIEKDDGCYGKVSVSCKDKLSNDDAVCRTVDGLGGCCIDECDTVGVSCSDNSKVTCKTNTQTGCKVEVVEECSDGFVCEEGGTDGPTCCDYSIYSSESDGFKCESNELFGVKKDNETGCFQEYFIKDCANFDDVDITGISGCKYNESEGRYNCCESDCNEEMPDECDGEEKIRKCIKKDDGCYGKVSVNCKNQLSNDDAVCGDDVCCVNECNEDDPLSCDEDFKWIEGCEKDQDTGCYKLKPLYNCLDDGKACYPGESGAECGDIDNTPPIVELTSSGFGITNIDWVEMGRLFGDGKHLRVNSNDNQILLNKLSDAKNLVKTNNWGNSGAYDKDFIDISYDNNGSVGLKELTGSGYPSSGYYTSFVDGGEIDNDKRYKWDSFSLNGTFPSDVNTKIDLQIISSSTINAPSTIDSSGCGVDGIELPNESVDLTQCNEVKTSDRYLHYRATLHSD